MPRLMISFLKRLLSPLTVFKHLYRLFPKRQKLIQAASDSSDPSSSLRHWSKSKLILLDLRPRAEYVVRRLVYSVGIPYDSLSDRLHELPDRATPLAVLAKQSDLKEVLTFLRERRWDISFAFADLDELWTAAAKLPTETRHTQAGYGGGSPSPAVLEGASTSVGHLHLFNPSPFLAEVIGRIEADLPAAAGGRWRACDVGCGSGRDAVFLAMRARWDLVAVDRLPHLLDKVRRFADDYNVGPRVTTEAADIKASGTVVKSVDGKLAGAQSFHEHEYSLVLCVRFGEKGFIPQLPDMVQRGGYLLFVHFADVGIAYSSPKDPRKLMRPKELSHFLAPRGFQVLVDRVDPNFDGRFLNCFLAKKL